MPSDQNDSCRVVVVEDHALVREMLVGIIVGSLHHQVIAECTSAQQALAVCLREKPDLVIVDWALPDGRGFDVIREAAAKLVQTRWVCISSNEQEHLVQEAIDLGVHGFVLKKSSLSIFKAAIAAVLKGESFYCPASSKLLVEALRSQSGAMKTNLTRRERDVLRGIARGDNPKTIAHQFRLEIKTVHNHLASLKEKLGIREPAGLVRYAIKHGYVEEP
jgi:two-component system, NarL family, response regulator NreC